MRKVYLTAHNKVLGLADYEAQDDAFMDLIDIKLALLFDRAGRVNTTKTLTGDDAEKIEEALKQKDFELGQVLKIRLPNDFVSEMAANVSDTAKPPVNEWK